MAKSKMTALQIVNRQNEIMLQIWALRKETEPDDVRIINLQSEWDLLEDAEPSDSNTLTDQEVKDLDDLIML